jgi:hypothetical protein
MHLVTVQLFAWPQCLPCGGCNKEISSAWTQVHERSNRTDILGVVYSRGAFFLYHVFSATRRLGESRHDRRLDKLSLSKFCIRMFSLQVAGCSAMSESFRKHMMLLFSTFEDGFEPRPRNVVCHGVVALLRCTMEGLTRFIYTDCDVVFSHPARFSYS